MYILSIANFEIQRLSKEIIDQTNKADGVEFISRENERLKNNIAKLETDLLMSNHKIAGNDIYLTSIHYI